MWGNFINLWLIKNKNHQLSKSIRQTQSKISQSLQQTHSTSIIAIIRGTKKIQWINSPISISQQHAIPRITWLTQKECLQWFSPKALFTHRTIPLGALTLNHLLWAPQISKRTLMPNKTVSSNHRDRKVFYTTRANETSITLAILRAQSATSTSIPCNLKKWMACIKI